MFTVFPSPPAQSARPRLLRTAVGCADVWLLSAKSTLTGLSCPSAVCAWQAKTPYWHCSGVLRNQEGKCEFKQGPALQRTCLRELAFLSPSLENYCFRCFPKTTDYHFNSFSSYFMSQVPFPPFLHIEPMQGKKKGPALIQKPPLGPRSAQTITPALQLVNPSSPQLHRQKNKIIQMKNSS